MSCLRFLPSVPAVSPMDPVVGTSYGTPEYSLRVLVGIILGGTSSMLYVQEVRESKEPVVQTIPRYVSIHIATVDTEFLAEDLCGAQSSSSFNSTTPITSALFWM